jgi:hypothetical protein
LFERRYKAWLVDVDQYFAALLRYIHRNPVKAHMVARPEEYPWSSHRAYLGETSLPWLTVDFGLALFGKTAETARQSFCQFVAQEDYASEARLLTETHPEDARILGGDKFVASLPRNVFRPRQVQSLAQVAERICGERRVSLALVQSTARHKPLTEARVQIALEALQGRIATQREIAHYLGRDPASLSELLARHRER